MSTGLDDDTVARIVTHVISVRGYLDVDLAVELILAARARRWARPARRRHLTLVDNIYHLAQTAAPSGAA